MVLAPSELLLLINVMKWYSEKLHKQMKAPTARGHYKHIADIEALTEEIHQHYLKLIT